MFKICIIFYGLKLYTVKKIGYTDIKNYGT